MKIRKVLGLAAIMFVGLMFSCQQDSVSNLAPENSSVEKMSALSASDSEQAMLKSLEPSTSNMKGIYLGAANSFEILSETGVTDVYKSSITGDVGSSPITGAAILVTCSEVVGTIYSVDAAGPLPCTITNASLLTSAVSDMLTAYNDGAGRINPDFLELGAGNIGGMTLKPGLYNWSSSVVIPADVAIAGGPNDIWIFQIAGTLDMSSAVNFTLQNGAQAKNIYWVVAGAVTLGTTSHFEGNILGKTGINLLTGASINGRLLAQTAVTLQMNTVNMPN